jgi:hypothetical protein
MSSTVTNQITLIGNDAIGDLSKEINFRFSLDFEKNGPDKTAVGRILYGLTGINALLSREISASWICCEYPLDDLDSLRLISGNNQINEVQDHIVKYASKIDPKVISYLEYTDEYPRFIGVRYAISHKNKIHSYSSHIDTIEYTVETDDEIYAVKEELEEQGYDSSKIITWEDIYIMLRNAREIEYLRMKEENPWVQTSALDFYI